jgi:hypothetical protein
MMIAAGCDIASVSRQLGHANVAVTLGTYSHWFQKRTESGLGAMLEAFLEKKMVVKWLCPVNPPTRRARKSLIKLLGLLGFEPRTKGL